MKNLTEKDWITKSGLRAVVNIHGGAGHRCGYVLLPKDHPKYVEPTYETYEFGEKEFTVMDYYNMYPNAEVHGGLTYAKEVSEENSYPVVADCGGTWLGFDAAHCDDGPDYDVWETMIEDEKDQLLFDTLKDMESRFPTGMRAIRDLDFMISECEELATQLDEGD